MTNDHQSSEGEKHTAGIHIGDILGGIRGSIIAGRDVILGTTEQRRAMRNRRAMLQLVKNTWIKGVLEDSLHGAAMIELGMEERADAVERPWDMVVQMPDREDQNLPPGTKIIDVFDEANGSLLILGEPGSGKTTMLLDLARDTIARAEEDPTQPIPVVFKLSSWMERRRSIARRLLDHLLGKYSGPLAEWLLDELNTKYQIPKYIARSWVENDALLLLLDGLDEVAEKQQVACVKAINRFCGRHMVPLVVCTRGVYYQSLTAQLKVQKCVLLQPLTSQQVEEYLEGTGTDLLAVRRTLQYDPRLQSLARSPLILSVMTLAYRGMTFEDLGSLDSNKSRLRHVFDVYVRQMFKRRIGDHPYSPEQTIYWLAWLARKMSYHSQSTFLVQEMQPSLLNTWGQKRLHTIAWSVLSGPIMGLALGLVVGLVSNPPTRGLPIGIVGGLTLGLFFGLVTAPARIESLMEPLLPDYDIGRSLRIALVVGFVGGLIGALTFGMATVPIAGLFYGFSIALILMLYLGGFAAIQHFTLRFILYLKGCIPWNLTRFLDYATDLIFLCKVGGGYIFVHRLLQEYFASLYEE